MSDSRSHRKRWDRCECETVEGPGHQESLGGQCPLRSPCEVDSSSAESADTSTRSERTRSDACTGEKNAATAAARTVDPPDPDSEWMKHKSWDLDGTGRTVCSITPSLWFQALGLI